MTVPIPEITSWNLKSLNNVEEDIWVQLEWSAQSHRGPFHIGTLATLDASNPFPQLRNIVLRHVNKANRSLFFHTDIRSPKCKQIMANPQIGLLFYHAESRLQLRIEAQALLHNGNEIAKNAWERSRLSSKLCYTSELPPGTPIKTVVLNNLIRHDVSDDELMTAKKNFVVVEVVIEKMDWLFLQHKGHIRASFNLKTGEKNWLQV